MTTKTAEQQLADALAEIQKLKDAAREEAARKARYPWENPETVQEQQRMSYNLKIEPELYLKIKWLMENKGGIRSMQVFFDRAGNELADKYLKELGAI
jgi:hypothetical protein